jgi:hypothetical protein
MCVPGMAFRRRNGIEVSRWLADGRGEKCGLVIGRCEYAFWVCRKGGDGDKCRDREKVYDSDRSIDDDNYCM